MELQNPLLIRVPLPGPPVFREPSEAPKFPADLLRNEPLMWLLRLGAATLTDGEMSKLLAAFHLPAEMMHDFANGGDLYVERDSVARSFRAVNFPDHGSEAGPAPLRGDGADATAPTGADVDLGLLEAVIERQERDQGLDPELPGQRPDRGAGASGVVPEGELDRGSPADRLTRSRLLLIQWMRLVNLGGAPLEWGGWWWDHQNPLLLKNGQQRFFRWVAEQGMNGAQPGRLISVGETESDCQLGADGDNLIARPWEPYLTIGPFVTSLWSASKALGVSVRRLTAWKMQYVLDPLVIRRIFHWFIVMERKPVEPDGRLLQILNQHLIPEI